jgi:hypothetical protein
MKYYLNYIFIISTVIAFGCRNNTTINDKDNTAGAAFDEPKSLNVVLFAQPKR